MVKTTVICAVWHKDPKRMSLLGGHMHNLLKQTVPVEIIYVFDGNDQDISTDLWPPTINKIIAHREITIYQAWNLALSQVSTPFVMNLNLDDRLAPDAIELMQKCMDDDPNAGLVGGDWRICYSQEQTDKVDPSHPCADIPFLPDWPPVPPTYTRLGSGDGKRGTLGPAVMWRMECHIGAPRYPWRFDNGDTIKVVADVVWWSLVTMHLKKRAYRVAKIIGNYHSHPADQAEFRDKDFDELKRANYMGISVL